VCVHKAGNVFAFSKHGKPFLLKGNFIKFLKCNKHWVQSKRHMLWFSTKTTFNVYVSHRSQIQLEDEDHVVDMSFR